MNYSANQSNTTTRVLIIALALFLFSISSNLLGQTNSTPTPKYPGYLEPYTYNVCKLEIAYRNSPSKEEEIYQDDFVNKKFDDYFSELSTSSDYAISIMQFIKDCRDRNIDFDPKYSINSDVGTIFYPKLEQFLLKHSKNDLQNAYLFSFLIDSLLFNNETLKFYYSPPGSPNFDRYFPILTPSKSPDPILIEYITNNIIPKLKLLRNKIKTDEIDHNYAYSHATELNFIPKWIISIKLPNNNLYQNELFEFLYIHTNLKIISKYYSSALEEFKIFLSNDNLNNDVKNNFIKKLNDGIESSNQQNQLLALKYLITCYDEINKIILFRTNKKRIDEYLVNNIDNKLLNNHEEALKYLVNNSKQLAIKYYNKTSLNTTKAYTLFLLAKNDKNYLNILKNQTIILGKSAKNQKNIFNKKADVYRKSPTSKNKEIASNYYRTIYTPTQSQFLLYAKHLHNVLNDKEFRSFLKQHDLFIN